MAGPLPLAGLCIWQTFALPSRVVSQASVFRRAGALLDRRWRWYAECGPVAQWLELAAHNSAGAGSSPARPTMSDQHCKPRCALSTASQVSLKGVVATDDPDRSGPDDQLAGFSQSAGFSTIVDSRCPAIIATDHALCPTPVEGVMAQPQRISRANNDGALSRQALAELGVNSIEWCHSLPSSSLSCVRVSKSPASWRSSNWLEGSPVVRLTMRPRATAGRSRS